MKINKSDPRHWLLLLRQGLYTLIAAGARYLSSKPGRPVVILYGHQLSGNLQALYEEWQLSHKNEIDCYFLSLDPQYSAVLHKQGITVLRCGALRDMLIVGRSSAIITDHGLHAMSPLIALTNILFIDVWHGIPFKGFIPEDFKLQHRYDEIWVSSGSLKQIYQEKFGFCPSKVYDMGYARADKLFRGDRPTGEFRKVFGVPLNKKIVLYAPTWQQDDNGHELFPFGETQESFIESLSSTCREGGATLVIRSHLNARINHKVIEDVIYSSMRAYPDTEDLLQETDILICDWSSIAFDYLALNRPAIFLDVKSPYKNGLSLGPEYRFGEITADMQNLEEKLGKILQDPTEYEARLGPVHADITAHVYGENTNGRAAQQQLRRLAKLIQPATQ